jgi:hypothetical protein
MHRLLQPLFAAALIMAPFGARAADLVVWWDKGFYLQEDVVLADFPYRDGEGRYLPVVVLYFEYWGIVGALSRGCRRRVVQFGFVRYRGCGPSCHGAPPARRWPDRSTIQNAAAAAVKAFLTVGSAFVHAVHATLGLRGAHACPERVLAVAP